MIERREKENKATESYCSISCVMDRKKVVVQSALNALNEKKRGERESIRRNSSK